MQQTTYLVSLFTSLIQQHVLYFFSNFHLNAVSALGTAVTVAEDNCNMPIWKGKGGYNLRRQPCIMQTKILSKTFYSRLQTKGVTFLQKMVRLAGLRLLAAIECTS